jgi:filamentous hemagglutinin family protein
MNRIYRTLWSVATQSWVAVPETAKSGKKKSVKSSTVGLVASFALSWGLIDVASAQAPPAINQLPTGGSVARGTATISQTATAQAAAMTVNQSSQRAVLNWNTFNLGSNASINFVQPNLQAVTLNRVNDSNPSQIFGRITANGQVFLTNANGIYFSPTSSVDVGAFTATTHSISDDKFMSGNYVFERNGSTGKVINEGRISAELSGYVALLASEVQNAGVVVARAGTVAMAAGELITLNVDGMGSLAGIVTTPSAIATLIENKQAVQAPDGQIILSAMALNKLQSGVIKNSGSLEVNSLVSKGGKIYLEGDEINLTGTSKIEAKGTTGGGTVLIGGDWQGSGDLRQATKVTMEAGASIDASATDHGDGGKVVLWSVVHNADSVTRVNGSIKAEAGPNGGDGGQVETSGHHLIVDDIQVSTQSSKGQTGSWLLDPVDFTIAASGGDMTGTALGTLLGSNDITIQSVTGTNTLTSYYGSAAGSGNINVNDAVSWSSHKLTLAASNNIYINDVMTATSTASLALKYGLGANASGNTSVIKTKIGPNNTFVGKINLPAGTTNFTTTQGLDGTSTSYTVITSLGAANSTTTTDLQGMNGGATLNYALGADINATATSGWNTGSGFTPIKTSGFNAIFNGLGHTVSNLTINRGAQNYVGFFYSISSGLVQNFGLTDASISGKYAVGSLAGRVLGTGKISNSFATGTVSSNNGGYVGGLVGQLSAGVITDSYSSATVTLTVATGTTLVGGLVGWMQNGTISKSYASGSVTSSGYDVGGLIGLIELSLGSTFTISDNYAVGSVTGTTNTGGLIGRISSSNLTLTSTLSRNFSNNSVSGSNGSATVAGVIGNGNSPFTSSNNYWNSQTSGQSVGMGTATGTAYSQTGFTGLTNAQMQISSNFSGFDFTTTPVWKMPSGSAPVLCNFQTLCSLDTNIYLIATSTQSSTYGSNPTLMYCYSSSAASCVQVSYAGIPSTSQPFDLTVGTSNSVNVSGGVTGSLAVSSSLTNTSNAGTYALTFTPTLTLSGYSFLAGNAVNFTINKAHLTVTAADASRAYGAANPSLTATVSGFVNNETLATSGVTGTGSATTTAIATTGAGTATITAGVGTLSATNYDFTNLVNGTLTINKAHLTVTADNATKTYGDANPSFTTTVSGFVNGQNLGSSGVTGAGSATSTATTTTGAGTATITAGAGTLAAANYDFTNLVDGTLTINKAHLTVTANATSKIYGDANPSLTTTVSGFVNSETLATSGVTGSASVTTTATTTTGVGTATITAGTGNLSAANYDFTNLVNGTLTINQRPITLSADLVNKTYGAADPALTASITAGSKASADSLADVLGTLTRSAGETVGSYDVALGAGAKAANYAITFASNNRAFTINKANLTVTPTVGLAKTYGGVDPSLTYTTSALLGGDASIAGLTGSLSRAVGENAGSYNYTTTGLSSTNYTFSLAGGASNFTINKANLTVTPTVGLAKTYGGVDPSLTYTTSALLGGDASIAGLTGSLSRAVGESAGSYNYATTGLSSTNYTFSLAGGADSFTINKAHLTVTAADASRAYGAANPSLTATVSGFVNNETLATSGVTGTGSATTTAIATTGAGTATITAGVGTLSATNYDFTNLVNGTLTINKAHLTVTADNATKTYGDANPSFTTTVSGFVNGQNLGSSGVTGAGSATSTATTTTGAGTATITAGAGTLAAANYDFTNLVDGTLTISKANLTKVTASKVYDSLSSVTASQMRAIEGVNGETFTASAGTATISDKNVMTANKTLTDLSGLTLVGGSNTALSNNYNLNSNLPTAGSNNQVTVSAKALGLSIPGASRVYDGTTSISPSGPVTLLGVEPGDVVTMAGGGTVTGYVDKNVGNNKTVTYTALALTGAGASNYSLPSNPTSNANITPAALSISGITVADKTYDATTTATVSTTSVVKTGLIAGDTVNIATTGTFSDKNVGTNIPVTLASTYTGADVANYNITDQTSTTASISKAHLTVTADNASKLFGNANPALTVSLSGFVGGETLGTSGVTGTGSATTTATVTTVAGVAPITASIGTLAASNYDFAHFVDGQLTITAISSLANDQVSTLIGSQLSSLSAAQIGSFTGTQLQVFSAPQLSALTVPQIAGMTATQIGSLNYAQLQALTALQVAALTPIQLSALTPAQISYLTNASNLTESQVLSLSPNQVTGLSSTQISSMSARELASFSNDQLQALSPLQISSIAPAAFATFSPAQIMALSISQVKNLTVDQLLTFTPSQVASISAVELAYFDAQQLAAIGIYPKVETSNTVQTVTAEVTQREVSATYQAPIPVMTEVATTTVAPAQVAIAQPRANQPEAPVAQNLRDVPSSLFPQSNEASASSGVLPVTILNAAQVKPITAGVAFEQDADAVSLRITSAPSAAPVNITQTFRDKLTTFMVASDKGEMVAFEGSLINNRIVIIAPSSAARRLARIEMNTVLAAAVTSLGRDKRVMLAELKGVVFDLR